MLNTASLNKIEIGHFTNIMNELVDLEKGISVTEQNLLIQSAPEYWKILCDILDIRLEI
jgi:hypothetical protein